MSNANWVEGGQSKVKLSSAVLSQVGDSLEKVEAGIRQALTDASVETQKVTLHLAESGGKRIRPVVTLLSARLFQTDVDHVVPVAVAAELIHMATLVHDDVIDRAETRRGRETVNNLWGNQTSVLTGDALLAKALVLLVDNSTPAVVKIMADMIYRMCEGEIAQNVTGGNINQTEQDYFQRIEKKTALFFAACCQAGSLMGGATEPEAQALYDYGLNAGMAFQIADDLLDVQEEAEVVGKPVGNDLLSGIITLPVIYLLRHSKNSTEVRDILDRSPLTRSDVDDILSIVRRNGAVDYTSRVASDFARKARQALDGFPETWTLQLFQQISSVVIDRHY